MVKKDSEKTIGELRKEGKSFEEISKIGESTIDKEKVRKSKIEVVSDAPEDIGKSFGGTRIKSSKQRDREFAERQEMKRQQEALANIPLPQKEEEIKGIAKQKEEEPRVFGPVKPTPEQQATGR